MSSPPQSSLGESHRGRRRRRGHIRDRLQQNTTDSSTQAGVTSATPIASVEVEQRRNQIGDEVQRSGGRRSGNGRSRRRNHSGAGVNVPAGSRTFGADITAQPGLNTAAAVFIPGAPLAPVPPVAHQVSMTPAITQHSAANDLSTRIHEDISNKLYDCVICSNEVTRFSSVWSCDTCYVVLHLRCVDQWYSTQMSKVDADSWRCPGCNTVLAQDPERYHCWCGKEPYPKQIAGLPPHSCGQTCSRVRGLCPHPCLLQCHAGPCPPCGRMAPAQPCLCGKSTRTKRCGEAGLNSSWTCEETCGELLACGEHECQKKCHGGLCGECRAKVQLSCYCAKQTKNMACCDKEEPMESVRQDSENNNVEFVGWFDCQQRCERLYDCGHHKCSRTCHSQEPEAAPCPFVPMAVKDCCCGKTPLSELKDSLRQRCTDPVPTCSKVCGKTLSCGHECPDKCHGGDCAACIRIVEVSCRCGRPFGKEVCSDNESELPVCERSCQSRM